jgi:hypothetical protein
MYRCDHDRLNDALDWIAVWLRVIFQIPTTRYREHYGTVVTLVPYVLIELRRQRLPYIHHLLILPPFGRQVEIC